jgi:hypothetical protein
MNLESELTAADLILALIDSAADPALPASYLVETGQMFGLDAGAIRVALTRLVKRNVLAQVERGRYGLGKSGDPLHQAVRNWGDAEQRLISWKGDWIAVSAVHLSRRNKTQVRRREKALRFFGLAQAAPGLWIRPANLREDFTSLRRSLCAIAGDQLDDWWLYSCGTSPSLSKATARSTVSLSKVSNASTNWRARTQQKKPCSSAAQ